MALTTSNVTSGFIDLATYDELEKYMYGGADATAYFVRETRKSTWFTQVPVCLSKSSGEAQFGQEWSAQITRSGDYLLNLWLQVEFPFLINANSSTNNDIRWVQNLMHNLVEECSISFNDLVAARFDSAHLDFWSQFAYSSNKQSSYNAMIGNAVYESGKRFSQTSQSYGMNVGVGNNRSLPGNVTVTGTDASSLGNLEHPTLYLPLPFFFGRDSGVALPTASLPYNEMKVNFKFRDWDQLLVKDAGNGLARGAIQTEHATLSDFKVVNGTAASANIEPRLTNVNVWGNYAIVSNDERKRMACAPRDMLIEQVQSAPVDQVRLGDSSPSFNLRFSHAIKLLFFGLRNSSSGASDSGPVDLSYYTAVQPSVLGAAGGTRNYMPVYVQDGAGNNMLQGQNNPIEKATLVYENTNRLQNVSPEFCSLVQSYNHGPHCGSNAPGMNMYSYSLDFTSLDPLGSTNYGKLTNVSLQTDLSQLAAALQTASSTAVEIGSGATTNKSQTYEFICSVVNNNVVRISGGALGFPIL